MVGHLSLNLLGGFDSHSDAFNPLWSKGFLEVLVEYFDVFILAKPVVDVDVEGRNVTDHLLVGDHLLDLLPFFRDGKSLLVMSRFGVSTQNVGIRVAGLVLLQQLTRLLLAPAVVHGNPPPDPLLTGVEGLEVG